MKKPGEAGLVESTFQLLASRLLPPDTAMASGIADVLRGGRGTKGFVSRLVELLRRLSDSLCDSSPTSKGTGICTTNNAGGNFAGLWLPGVPPLEWR